MKSLTKCYRCGASAPRNHVTNCFPDGSQKSLLLCDVCITAFSGALNADIESTKPGNHTVCDLCGCDLSEITAVGGTRYLESGKFDMCRECMAEYSNLHELLLAVSPKLFEPKKRQATWSRLISAVKLMRKSTAK